MSQAEKEAISVLTAVIGKKYVLTDQKSVEFYSMDVYRSFEIPIAVVQPGSVEELQRLANDLIGYDVRANLQDIPFNTKVYAWTGNGRENFAERIHGAISGSKLYYLPENKSQWSINLSD